MARTIAANAAGRERYLAAGAELGIRAVPSQANFVLFDFGSPEREATVYDGLLRRGVITRACSRLGLPGCIRVSVGTPDECERFVATLAEVLAT